MKFGRNMKVDISLFSEDDKRVKVSNRIQMNNNLTAVSRSFFRSYLTVGELIV